MKKFFLFLGIFFLLLCTVAYVAIPPLVEDAVRQNIGKLPVVLGQPGVSSYDPPEVGKVGFNLLGRKLEIEKFRLKGQILDKKFGKTDVVYRLDKLAGTIPWRIFLLIGPFRDMAREANGFEPVLNSVSGRNLSISVAAGNRLQAESAIDEFSGRNILLQANVLGCVLDNLPLDGLDFLYGVGLDDFEARNIGGNIQSDGAPITHKLANVRISNWRGRDMASFGLSGLSLAQPGKEIFRLNSLELDRITFPDMPLMVELKNSARNPLVSLEVLHKIINGPPLVAATRIQELRCEKFGLRKGLLNWLSSNPVAWNVSISGLTMPAAMVKKETGLTLAGLREISLDCDLATEEKNSRMDYNGSLRSPSLGTLVYSFDMEAIKYNMITMLAAPISNFKADYADSGMVARVAEGVTSNAQAAMMALKIALGHFCSRETGENEQLRAAIESFVERPGKLSVKARKTFSLAEIGTQAVMGDLGDILEAVATPGPRSLEEAMRAIRGHSGTR